jgi:biopolymer transport protein ExbB
MDIVTKIGMSFEHGGMWMWPILMIQLASIAIVIERVYALFIKRKVNQAAVATALEDSIRRGELETLVKKATQMGEAAPLAKVAIAGATAARNLGGKDEIQGKMDEVLLAENSALDKRTGFLAMFGNVATLTGLLGTITGMIKSFAAVSYANPAEKATLLAAGISEAMNATAYGLIVAIPALVAYAILANRANNLAEDLNQSALKVFNLLSYAYEPVGFKTFRSEKGNSSAEVTQ